MVIFGLKPIGLIYKPNATNCMGHTIKIRGLKNYMSNVESDLDIISETVGKFLCEIKLATVHYWWSDCHMNTAVRPIIISVRKWYSLCLPNSVTFLKKEHLYMMKHTARLHTSKYLHNRSIFYLYISVYLRCDGPRFTRPPLCFCVVANWRHRFTRTLWKRLLAGKVPVI